LSDTDRELLLTALELADQARGRTSPNPLVGALVVRDGRVIGRGFHRGPGTDHAEVAAMKEAAGPNGDSFAGRLRGATMVVTLEPCSHHGRTPPCAEALIEAGVSRVVVGIVDPWPGVNGRGIARLREAGIEVQLADEAVAYRLRRQNEPFRKHALAGLPFVTYKYAVTLDGRVATESGHSAWISGPASRRRVQGLRAASDAVLVGAGTLRADDPRLTVRDVDVPRQPLRVVIDPALSIGKDAALVRSAAMGPVLLVCGTGVPAARRQELRREGVEVLPVAGGDGRRPDPRAVGRLLARRMVQTVLLEGGPTLAAAWWEAGLVDKVVAFVCPVIAGGAAAPGPLPAPGALRMDEALRLRDVTIERTGEDVCITGYRQDPW